MIDFRLIKIARQQHGSAMIELCIILPILILMLLGALDIGLLLRQAMIVMDSTRVGAEYATIYYSSSDTGNMQAYATYQSVGVPNYNAVAAISCTCGVGGAAVACSGSCAGSVQPVQYAQVTATATLPLVFGVTGFPATIPIKSVTRVRVAWKGGN